MLPPPSSNEQKPKKSVKDHALTIIGAILCVILVPLLVINVTLLVKSFTNENEVPTFLGYTPFIILSDSMSPTIEVGDLIICKEIDAQDVQEGDIISFYDPTSTSNAVVTHRINQITKDGDELAFQTKGDANNAADQVLIGADDIIAIYTGTRFAGLGDVAMFMQTTAGLVVCVIVPLLLFIAYDLIRRRSIDKRRKAQEADLRRELEELKAQQESTAVAQAPVAEATSAQPAPVEAAPAAEVTSAETTPADAVNAQASSDEQASAEATSAPQEPLE